MEISVDKINLCDIIMISNKYLKRRYAGSCKKEREKV